MAGNDASTLVQEPTTSATAEIDADNLGTGPQGLPLRRERVQVVQDRNTTRMLEIQTIELADAGTLVMSKRSYERISQTDRRGSTGRGSTR